MSLSAPTAAASSRSPARASLPALIALSGALLLTSCGGGGGGSGGVAPTSPTAPGGFYVVGRHIYGPDGKVAALRGVSRPSLEWNPQGENLSAADFTRMAAWGATCVRLPLNQGFWLTGSGSHDAGYRTRVETTVSWALAAGLAVILDLHRSDRGNLAEPTPAPQRMADANSVTFWSEVAAAYKDEGRVIFELYNEPHDVTWSVWRDGGASGDGFTAVGMQDLYDAVRGAGAENLVLVGGLNYAYDLKGVPTHRLTGYNIAYASHPYDFAGKQPANWERDFGFLAGTEAVVVTEFGSFDCSDTYVGKLIEYAEGKGMGWVAWAWYPGGCSFPALITDLQGTPSPPGAKVRAELSLRAP